MKNVFCYWSDETKEDKKIIDVIHREVKLDKFQFFFFEKKNAMVDVLKFIAKIGN